jgi:hypothetical protein
LEFDEILYVIPGRLPIRRGTCGLLVFGRTSRSIQIRLPEARAAAALALDHLVTFLQQALALAILAFLLLLDVGAFFIGHAILPGMILPSAH